MWHSCCVTSHRGSARGSCIRSRCNNNMQRVVSSCYSVPVSHAWHHDHSQSLAQIRKQTSRMKMLACKSHSWVELIEHDLSNMYVYTFEWQSPTHYDSTLCPQLWFDVCHVVPCITNRPALIRPDVVWNMLGACILRMILVNPSDAARQNHSEYYAGVWQST